MIFDTTVPHASTVERGDTVATNVCYDLHIGRHQLDRGFNKGETIERDHWYFNIRRIYDSHALGELFVRGGDRNEAERTQRVFETVQKAIIKNVEPELAEYVEHGYIYQITGSYKQLTQWLTSIVSELFETETGGDDDTYDYWPDAIDAVHRVAIDLDTIAITRNEPRVHVQTLREAYIRFIAPDGVNKGRVSEYQFDDNDIEGEDRE